MALSLPRLLNKGEYPLCGGTTDGGGAVCAFYFRGKVANVAAHLTNKKKKQIIADRIEGMSLRKIADKHGCSEYAVRQAIKNDPDFAAKIAKKKEQNTKEMLEYFTEQKGKAQQLLSSIIEALSDPDKLARANVRDLATAYGIIADKFLQTAPRESDELLQKAKEILGAYDGAIK